MHVKTWHCPDWQVHRSNIPIGAEEIGDNRQGRNILPGNGLTTTTETHEPTITSNHAPISLHWWVKSVGAVSVMGYGRSLLKIYAIIWFWLIHFLLRICLSRFDNNHGRRWRVKGVTQLCIFPCLNKKKAELQEYKQKKSLSSSTRV
jgi:hypothetical protein